MTDDELVARFEPLRRFLERHNAEAGSPPGHEWHHALDVTADGGLLDVTYQGETNVSAGDERREVLEELLTLLTAGVAPRLRSFSFRTPGAYAANGTCDFHIDPLITGNVDFPRLERVALDQGGGEHGYKLLNSPALGADYEEGGALAALLAKAPALRELVTPSPPNAAFFDGPSHGLRSLDVDAGYDHLGFIRNLAGCRRFPELARLRFTEFRQDYMDDWRALATPFEDYLLLFESPVVARLEAVELREVSLTPEQVGRLLAIRSRGVSITHFGG